MSKVTNETLVEAANAYIDLLTARRGEAVNQELEKLQQEQLDRAEKLIRDRDRVATVLAESIRGEIQGRQQAAARLRQQGNAAAAKLGYLLGLGREAPLVPMDTTLAPVDLVDATVPVNELVDRALANGPGVRELESMLGVIQNALTQASGPARFLPTFQVNVLEEGFGAGPGARLDWDNRLDICLKARWNLTEALTACERKRIAESKLRQVQLTYDDLRGKLTSGVEQARDAIHAGREQVTHASEQIRHASESYRLNNLRLQERVPGVTSADVMQSIRGLEAAHFSYLAAINAYNKAQINLLLLLGPAGDCHGAH